MPVVVPLLMYCNVTQVVIVADEETQFARFSSTESLNLHGAFSNHAGIFFTMFI